MSTGWSWYVIFLVVLNIGGCAWLLWWTARRRPGDPKPEETSHYWDGDITEYNKPLPRWWIIGFYLTIAFSIGYLIWYPGFGNLPGIAGWTSAGEHDADKARRDAQLEETFGQYTGQPFAQLAADPKAMELGRSIFANTCAACHGSSAQGAPGYPNLTDNVWNWGGEPDRILETVLDGREGVMAPLGTVLTGMGGDVAITQAAAYVRALRSDDIEATLRNDFMAARGKKYFDGLCMACHGIDGTGNQDLGAPDLTSHSTPLYPNTLESIRTTIIEGRHGVMPAHRDLLGETRSRLVAAYVWSLSQSAEAGASTEQQ
ncbi:MAG TPA: cytochrome-c oxidase, cbb3-type subunit III [Gammaproteobacteria bacterium]|nr:cytochrome-c oxidase, cbb3-type subunit III [Luteimonas sp.]HRO27201.1 cytochrome-c oxidase, cbb3-type subunit III [Luteimonas sp.]HRP35562.1 cytochrome-c oxidase, cbb3-type subunit III [Gammaproteobacteria bacterium]HRP72053.1 cytochrome-c oxidase, cbb3-type subunit III [Luteimonas sp.]